MEHVASWIGLAMTALGMILGGTVFVQSQIKSTQDRADTRLAETKRELEDRHREDLQRLDKLIEEERLERRRELDRMAEEIKGFADVAGAVIAMGKSLEHLTERHADSQRRTEASLSELTAVVRDLSSRPTPRVRAPRAKK